MTRATGKTSPPLISTFAIFRASRGAAQLVQQREAQLVRKFVHTRMIPGLFQNLLPAQATHCGDCVAERRLGLVVPGTVGKRQVLAVCLSREDQADQTEQP